MKKFTGQRLRNLSSNTGLVKLGLVVLLGLAAGVGRAQTNFASARVLTGDWGSVMNFNTGITPDPGAPSTAGSPPNAPLWYQWTAPSDGEVELDTIGSSRDTVLGVYAGMNVTRLSQVAANDDIYPFTQNNYIGVNLYVTNYIDPHGIGNPNPYSMTNPFVDYGLWYPSQPYGGPSGLRFNATAGTTYYFVVDTKFSTGQIVLNWAYHSSGVFRFATENLDYGSGMLLYQCAETESRGPYGEFGNVDADTLVHTYYYYNNPGVLVTITRVAGSSGRVSVDYTTVDGPANQYTGDVAAMAGTDYSAVSGTLFFDDFEMSKTILIPIIDDATNNISPRPVGIARPNRDFTIVLSNPQYATNEFGSTDYVSPPRVDSTFGQALVRILDVDIDPKGESLIANVLTNGSGTNMTFQTNYSYTPIPTNAVLNFQKSHYRVARDVTNFWGGTPVTIYVNRTGTNTAGTTAIYRINNYFLELQPGYDQQNMRFPLQPGSDYAMPDPPNANGLVMGSIPPDSPDFSSSAAGAPNWSGTLSWGSKDSRPKAIHFTVYNTNLTQFNKDFVVQLYRPNPIDSTIADPLGMVAETTVTILFDDQHPPPGSVDELYNADFNLDLKLPPANIPVTLLQNNPHPGTDGEVYGLAILTNNETVIVGDFTSYDGSKLNCIALADANGMPDVNFKPNSGANNFINAVALTASNQFVIVGGFTSFNGTPRNGIARVNTNGTLDSTFLNGLAGANSNVLAVAVQPDGKVLIGGSFDHVNGAARTNLARLNADGSLDATFNPGTNIAGTVYALALQPSGGGQIFVGGDFTVGGQNYKNIALLNSDGSLNTSFNPGTGPNNVVVALCWQPNGQVLLGGAFARINGISLNGIARLNPDGSIDTAGFSPGTGADDTVNCIAYSTNVITTLSITNISGVQVTNLVVSTYNVIYVGGSFTSFNGTHRLGFARLYTDGTVDTTFLDTAYNQFAGLARIYFDDPPGTVNAAGVQSDGNVMIAGSFDEVGGGQADKNIRNTNCWARNVARSFGNPDLWVSEHNGGSDPNIEPKSRDGVRNRNNVARLIGGSINGVESLYTLVNAYAPGNIGLVSDSYSINESGSSLSVSLARVNGGLGPAGFNFAVQPGLAASGVDYVYNASDPLYWIVWEYTSLWTRMHSHGLFGPNGIERDIYGRYWANNTLSDLTAVQVTVHPNPTVRGDLNAQFQLANPAIADQFYLGGQNIPLGVALGRSVAPFTLIDDNKQSGQIGFVAASFIATNTPAAISVVRSNGTYGRYSVTCSTSNGTAVAGIDYTALSQTKFFNSGFLTPNVFNVTVLDNGFIYTNPVEKTVNLRLSGLSGPVDGNATYGISNAVLRLINPNYQGYLSFSTTNYTGKESAGFITFVVNRTSGSSGALSVQYATANGTGPNAATNGVDYVGATNTLSWISGDASPRIVNITLKNTLTVGTNRYFTVSLRNPTNNNGAVDPSLMGLITIATNTIINDNNYGTLQFSAPSYLVREDGGYATITVIRTGGAAGSVSVNFTNSNGTATNGFNYYATNGVLTFVTNQIAATFTVQMKPDGVQDPPNFYFNVALYNPTNAALGSPANAIVNIVDTDSYNRAPGSPGTGTNSISGANSDVLALALQSNGQILVGGAFTQVNTVPENYVARLNADGSLDTTFPNALNSPGANGPVYALVNQTNGRILMAGAFTSVNGVFLNHLARLMTDGSLDTSFNPGPGADGAVYALAETFIGGVRKIYAGGAFGHIYDWSIARPGIARLNDDGTADASFATGLGADGAVYAIAVYPTNSIYAGKVLIGGAFTHYNGTNLNYIARLNADGSVDTTFSSAANAAVSALAIQPDGRVLVGGSFIQFNGVSLNRIARLNADGSLDAGFTAAIGTGINNTVESIALQADNRIVLGGLFTQVHGLTCNRIVRLLPTGAVDTTINFGDGANSDVDAVVVQPWDGMIIIGGAFTQFNDQPYNHLVRLYGGSTIGSTGGSQVIPAGSALIWESGPTNSIIDPGETVELSFAFTNSAGNNISTLYATLLLTNGIMSNSVSHGGTSPGVLQSYGQLNVGGPSISQKFIFTATNGANGQLITATFQLQSDANSLNSTNNLGLGVFTYMLGTLTNTFANTNLIVINQYGAATPYPSTINVSGVGGTLIKATVTFANLTHTYPADIDALLESPSQQCALLMANAGSGYTVHGVTLTFDDAASTGLPQAAQIGSGTYLPTAFFPVATFPVPAPAAPYATNLSSLYSGNPNGAWSLFVYDDTPGNGGAISNGWSLNFITASPIASLSAQPLEFSGIVYSNGIFQLTIVGATNSIIIQTATNLVPANWVNIFTSTAPYMSPFVFTDLNTSVYPHRFYRAVSGP